MRKWIEHTQVKDSDRECSCTSTEPIVSLPLIRWTDHLAVIVSVPSHKLLVISLEVELK